MVPIQVRQVSRDKIKSGNTLEISMQHIWPTVCLTSKSLYVEMFCISLILAVP
jgi:hypothetical protein